MIDIGFISSLVGRVNLSDSDAGLPRISIVMPCFNHAQFIERSILSILNQGYENLELIVIDGGSTDGTQAIIDKYKYRISRLVSEPDRGQSDALNKGFSLATGEIYGWLNSDDLYLPGAFRKAVETFQKEPEKKIVFGDWISIDESDHVSDIHHAFDFSLNHFKYEGFHLNAQAMFWRREVHERFGLFDVNLHNTMDYQMILSFGINEGDENFRRISEPLGAFRRYDAQKTGNFSDRVTREHIVMAERYGYTDKYRMTGSLKRLAYRVRRACWYLYRGGYPELAARINKAYMARKGN